jgi:hypothetical protein
MSRYTTQTEFAFGKLQRDRVIIPDTTASVVVEYWTGASWAVDENSPITKPSTIYTKGLRLRLTPAGGGFFIDGGESV